MLHSDIGVTFSVQAPIFSSPLRLFRNIMRIQWLGFIQGTFAHARIGMRGHSVIDFERERGGVHMVNEATASEFSGMLEARGVTRRSFMKLCGTIAVAAGLSELAAPRVASALETPLSVQLRVTCILLSGSRAHRAQAARSPSLRLRLPIRQRSCSSFVAQLLRDAFRGGRLVDGGSQGADD